MGCLSHVDLLCHASQIQSSKQASSPRTYIQLKWLCSPFVTLGISSHDEPQIIMEFLFMEQRSQRENRQSTHSFKAAVMLRPNDITVENTGFRNLDREQSVHCCLEHGWALLNFPQILATSIIKLGNTPQHQMPENKTVENSLLQWTSLPIHHLPRNHVFMLFVIWLQIKLIGHWLATADTWVTVPTSSWISCMLVIVVVHRRHSWVELSVVSLLWQLRFFSATMEAGP